MKSHRLIFRSTGAILLMLLVGCAATVPPESSSKTSVVSDLASKLKLGMTPAEVESIVGKPSIVYETTYGEKTDKPWGALVWKYYLDRDPKFKYVQRYRTNTFVFYRDSNPPKLNHWSLEQ